MTVWVRMNHRETGGSTLVPERAVDSYERRGWSKDLPAPRPVRNPRTKEGPAATPDSDSNESKEDG